MIRAPVIKELRYMTVNFSFLNGSRNSYKMQTRSKERCFRESIKNTTKTIVIRNSKREFTLSF